MINMAESPWMFSLSDITAKLPDGPGAMRFHYALRHGSMKLGLYAPHGTDPQGPHKQDELYLIATGSGTFVKGGTRHRFAPLDVLFVEAGIPHHFEDFSADFSTWVIFWGPEGGER
jgi:mannose-6-phosphate isomerase-like protein (cupin superfamily)